MWHHTASWSVAKLGLDSQSRSVSAITCGIISHRQAPWVSSSFKKKKVENDSLTLEEKSVQSGIPLLGSEHERGQDLGKISGHLLRCKM